METLALVKPHRQRHVAPGSASADFLRGPPRNVKQDYDAIIIGSGFSGSSAAIRRSAVE